MWLLSKMHSSFRGVSAARFQSGLPPLFYLLPFSPSFSLFFFLLHLLLRFSLPPIALSTTFAELLAPSILYTIRIRTRNTLAPLSLSFTPLSLFLSLPLLLPPPHFTCKMHVTLLASFRHSLLPLFLRFFFYIVVARSFSELGTNDWRISRPPRARAT